ncbi:hypothetical protein SDC9_70975 [bioreactor metagenome]|uniref:Uncharacterized protein n=1 Tax=bioreactor metagenome TaxID=1076179 RepID=A0A644Y7B5_9ZZZZ
MVGVGIDKLSACRFVEMTIVRAGRNKIGHECNDKNQAQQDNERVRYFKLWFLLNVLFHMTFPHVFIMHWFAAFERAVRVTRHSTRCRSLLKCAK